MLAGNNGLLSKTTQAREDTIIAQEKEQIAMAWNALILDKSTGNLEEDINEDNFETELKNSGNNTNVDYVDNNPNNDFSVTFIDTTHEYIVDKNGNITLKGNKIIEEDTSKLTADTIEKNGNASDYFGKYVTNYVANTENGVNYNNYNELVTNDAEKWQIFYIGDAGNGKNQIYLISSNYIKYDCMPLSQSGEALKKISNYQANFDTILNDYTGSNDVSYIGKELNSEYFNFIKNDIIENKNMKKLAFMTDIEIWDMYSNKYSDYAVGGPAIEILLKSYNEKHNETKNIYRVVNKKGYQLSKNSGTNWSGERVATMIDKNDGLYVKDRSLAPAVWLASPNEYSVDQIWEIHYDGSLDDTSYGSDYISGFRPLICLSSDVKIEADGDNYKIVEDGRQDKNKTKHTYKYTGTYQEFEALETGYYKIECFGARGGKDNWNSSFIANYGLGGYAKGVIKLNKGEKLYLYVGENGADGVKQKNVLTKTSFNGGGAGMGSSDNDDGGGAGGGATDVRLVSGDWNNFDSLKSRIMVAGGGSGGATVQSNFTSKSGGSGGGLEATGSIWKYSRTEVANHTYNATQLAGYKFGIGQDGITKGNAGGAGAGGGYYGGYSSTDSPAGGAGGGSGYISGYDGCNAISETSTENNIIHTNQSIHYSGKRFLDAELRADASATGKIIIEYLGQNYN